MVNGLSERCAAILFLFRISSALSELGSILPYHALPGMAKTERSVGANATPLERIHQAAHCIERATWFYFKYSPTTSSSVGLPTCVFPNPGTAPAATASC